MKVLLINLPSNGGANNFKYVLFPLGVGYIAAAIKSAGHNVEVLDLQYLKIIGKTEPVWCDYDVLCMGGCFWDVETMLWIARRSKKYNPSCPIVLGGSFCNSLPEVVFENSEVDYIVIGEGEKTIVELLNALQSPAELESIDGIMYRENGIPMETKRRTPEGNLDNLAFPARNLFLFKEVYRKRFAIPNNMRYSADILGSRGCPMSCIFCGSPFGKKVRVRSSGNILEEIKLLRDKYNVKHIRFSDEVFMGGRRDKIFSFLEAVIVNKTKFSWSGEMLVNLPDYEMLKLMKQSGCLYLVFGLESASSKILKEMKKPNDLDHFTKVLDWCRELDIKVSINMISGTFSETYETLNETSSYLNSINKYEWLTPNHIDNIVPIPGTSLYNEAKKRGLIEEDDFSYMQKLGRLSRAGNTVNLTTMKAESHKEALAGINTAIRNDYYSRNKIQRLWNFLGLLGCQFKNGLFDVSFKDIFPIIQSMAWGISKAKNNFIGKILQKIVFGKYYSGRVKNGGE